MDCVFDWCMITPGVYRVGALVMCRSSCCPLESSLEMAYFGCLAKVANLYYFVPCTDIEDFWPDSSYADLDAGKLAIEEFLRPLVLETRKYPAEVSGLAEIHAG